VAFLPLALNSQGGNVGIGTTSPTRKLHIVAPNMKVNNTGGMLVTGVEDGAILIGSDYAIGSIQGCNAAGTVAQNLMLQKEGMNVLSGTILPHADNLHQVGASGARWFALWAVNGTIQTSDERQKEDIADSDLGLEFIEQVRPIIFRDKAEKEQGIDALRYGLSAQQIMNVLGGRAFNGIVYDKETDMYGLNYAAMVTPLISAVQTLADRLDALESGTTTPKTRRR
jgi:hypothetical protein